MQHQNENQARTTPCPESEVPDSVAFSARRPAAYEAVSDRNPASRSAFANRRAIFLMTHYSASVKEIPESRRKRWNAFSTSWSGCQSLGSLALFVPKYFAVKLKNAAWRIRST